MLSHSRNEREKSSRRGTIREDSPELLETRHCFDDINGPINGDARLRVSGVTVGITQILVRSQVTCHRYCAQIVGVCLGSQGGGLLLACRSAGQQELKPRT